jgi:glycosyltransferase involved in cell wall biosynthesis
MNRNIVLDQSSDVLLSVLMPIYNGANVMSETINCLINQNLNFNWELVISDNGSTDETVEIAQSFHHPSIKIFEHEQNVGYPANLQRALNYAKGRYIFLCGHDDLIAANTLQIIVDLFESRPSLGAITRPYFAYDDNIQKPTRYKKKLTGQGDEIRFITPDSEQNDILTVFRTLDQLTGLAFRKSMIKVPFHLDVFTSHVYPFANILKTDEVAMIPMYSVAVRTWTSQSRRESWIYDLSPVESWAQLVNYTFIEDEFKDIRNFLLSNFCGHNSVGLIQIRNFASKPIRYFFREIKVMLHYRRENVRDLIFWGVVLYCLFTPPRLSIHLVDWFKRKISSRTVPPISFMQ